MNTAVATMTTLICEQCATSFSRRAWEVKRPGKGRYCSRQCANDALNFANSIKPSSPFAVRVCGFCEKSFEIPHHRVNNGRGLYCSTACYSKSRTRGVQRDCGVCGRHFSVKPSVAASGAGLFCSILCSNKSRIGVPTTTKTGQPHKFGRTVHSKPKTPPYRPEPKPSADSLVWAGSNTVNCGGCGRTRERGQRCQCERVEVAP